MHLNSRHIIIIINDTTLKCQKENNGMRNENKDSTFQLVWMLQIQVTQASQV